MDLCRSTLRVYNIGEQLHSTFQKHCERAGEQASSAKDIGIATYSELGMFGLDRLEPFLELSSRLLLCPTLF